MIGSRQNGQEVLSRATQWRFRFDLVSIEDPVAPGGARWIDLLSEARQTTPADLAALRIDFAAWLSRLSRRRRRIALALANGESTARVAAQFQVTPARIFSESAASWPTTGTACKGITGISEKPAVNRS